MNNNRNINEVEEEKKITKKKNLERFDYEIFTIS